MTTTHGTVITEYVPDYTTGPSSCRTRAHITGLGYKWCTRRPGHTGRHANGNGDRIVAVWGEPRPELVYYHDVIAKVRRLLQAAWE